MGRNTPGSSPWAFCGLVLPVLLNATIVNSLHGANPEQLEFFEKSIRPLLIKHCYECHSSDARTLEGGLSLQTRDGVLRGGDRGPAVVPGQPDNSLLIQAIRRTDANLQMPPDKPLPREAIAALEKWILDGAHDPRDGKVTSANQVSAEPPGNSWPYVGPQRRSLPHVRDAAWPWSFIDVHIRGRQEEVGLRPVADADKLTWLRRVQYDLVGLPPTSEDVAAFSLAREPDAADRMIDRLLASPRYGERWGRHWLDVVRYADTAGDNSDYPIPQMFKYRNWVIQAWNRDMPVDQFVREQLAGDLLDRDLLDGASPEERESRIIATGYIANARRFGSRVDDYPQHLTIEDTIDNVGRAFLGLSLNCARCHNHKFDPITSKDYYGLYAYFQNTRYPWPGIELEKRQRDLVPLVPADQVTAVLKERAIKREEHKRNVKRLENEKKSLDQEIAKLSSRRETSAGEKDIPSDEQTQRLDEMRKRAESLQASIKSAKTARDNFDQIPLPFEQAYAAADKKVLEPTRVQIKGDPERLGDLVERSTPNVFGGDPAQSFESVSGRMHLANWIANPSNPLTARVFVNRLWLHHFGRGIVPTPNDYGKQGKPPTHSELLDELALQFVEDGWSTKRMHRRMMLTRTYGLSTSHDETANRMDPTNNNLWRYRLRRLDAESIRDTLLTLSGNLDESMGMGHPFPSQTEWNFTQHKPFKAVYDTNRRSIYLMTQRIQRHPFLAIFDGPDTSASTGHRITSTTTLQALYFLNEPFVHDQVRDFVSRLLALTPQDEQRISYLHLMMMGRGPTSDETDECKQYLDSVTQVIPQVTGAEPARVAWESLVRAILRTNEFLYLN